jgi:DNA repair exonuclease SbcCD ATPase subunit/DNA repair exonuclease SbcCD nuclease subunit
MRIAHVSDIHIRNFKYRAEYRAAFQDLYEQLRWLKPDLIINTGDTVHSKLAVSPELYDELVDHMREMTEIAPYWITLGNHDLNLRNKSRSDAISPIVRALQTSTTHPLELLAPGFTWMPNIEFDQFRFWNYDIRGYKDFKPNPDKVNIGLYHGSILGCVTDMGFVMTDTEADLEQFQGMDYMMLGDIHKRQAFMKGRAWYAGSLIQQNYGEEPQKGFLVWDIEDKEKFEVNFYPVQAPGRFVTLQVPANLEFGDIRIPKGSRIKATVAGELTPSKRMDLERRLRDAFDPIEVITPDPSAEKHRLDELTIERLVGSREQMMRDHLYELGCTGPHVEDVIQLWNKYLLGIEDAAARGTTWNLKGFSWDNFMNYGESNSLDMSHLKGLVGVFAPNASGKSTIFDVLLEGLFDKLSKDAPRNIDLINDNRDKTRMVVEFESNGQPYTIERSIERITYGQRKLAETKQWGKMTLDFENDGDSLNGDSRPETERAIRSIIGTYEDFTLTTMVTQNPNFALPGGGDVINCKETDRRKILFRFLDLDVFEKVHQACRDDLKQALGGIKGDRSILEDEITAKREELQTFHREVQSSRLRKEEVDGEVSTLKKQLDGMGADRVGELMVEHTRADDRLAKKRSDAKRLRNDAERALKELEELEVIHLKTISSRPQSPDVALDKIAEQADLIRSQHNSISVELNKKLDQDLRGKIALRTLEDVPCEGKFPTCKFIKDAVAFQSEREVLEKAILTLTDQQTESKSTLTKISEYEVRNRLLTSWEKQNSEELLQLQKLITSVECSDRDFNDANRELLEAQDEYDAARKALIAADRTEIAEIKVQIKKLQSEGSGCDNRVEALLRAIGATDVKRQALEDELKNLDETRLKVAAYEYLADMTGKNGLPLRILTLVLPVINAEIAKILGGVVKFSVFFEHNPDEQSVSLFIRYGDYRSRPLSLGSGAEKFIASLAIRVALLSVSSLPKTDILIVDEGFGKLDPEYLESLQRMFEYLRDAFGTVFLISHVDSMRDMVDHSLEITSLDGYAHLEA